MSKAAFEHDGIEIFVDSDGTFTARKLGHVVTSTSLAGIKKKLDNKNEFQRFKAIVDKWGVHDQTEVVGIKRPRSNAKWRGTEWLLANGETAYSVIEDTPENWAVVEEIKKLRAERAEFDKRHRAALEVASKRLTIRKPE